MLRRVVRGVVDAQAKCEVGVPRWGGDDHPLGATLQPRRRLAPGEHAGRLDDHLDAVVGPGDLGRVADVELDLLPSTENPPLLTFTSLRSVPPTESLEQEGHRLAVAERVVDGDQLDPGSLSRSSRARKERPIRPYPLIPTRTVIRCASVVSARSHVASFAPADYSRACSAAASLPGSCTSPSVRATSAGTGSTPQSRITASSAARAPPRW